MNNTGHTPKWSGSSSDRARTHARICENITSSLLETFAALLLFNKQNKSHYPCQRHKRQDYPSIHYLHHLAFEGHGRAGANPRGKNTRQGVTKCEGTFQLVLTSFNYGRREQEFHGQHLDPQTTKVFPNPLGLICRKKKNVHLCFYGGLCLELFFRPSNDFLTS